MELDDFKNTGNTQQPPEITGEKPNSPLMDTLIEELKALDAKESQKIRLFIIIFGMFVVIYSSTFALQKGDMKTGFSLIVLGFILVLGYMYWRYRRIKHVDYNLPTKVFLADAEHRYRHMTPTDWLVSIPLLSLFIAGGSIVVHTTFTLYFGNSILPLVIYLIIMVLAVVVGFYVGYKDWKKDKGGMLEKIRSLREEFET
jgi:hypothetical protein